MTGSPVIKRVPGNVVKFDHEKDGYVSLANLSKIELSDLLAREEKLVNNAKFLSKLPDKGQKIKNFLDRIREEVRKRDEHDKLCGLLANLNVEESMDAINRLEWTGEYKHENTEADDEDEISPLKILATHSGTSASKEKQVRFQNSEKSITPSDLSNPASNLEDIDEYAKQLCHRFDSSELQDSKKRFHTNKPLKISSVKEIVKNEEPGIKTSTTINGSAVKMISLEESIKIQQEQTKNLKEIELKHAMEKLTNNATSINIVQPESNLSEYREPTRYYSDDEGGSASDEDADGEREEDTAVFYNLVD